MSVTCGNSSLTSSFVPDISLGATKVSPRVTPSVRLTKLRGGGPSAPPSPTRNGSQSSGSTTPKPSPGVKQTTTNVPSLPALGPPLITSAHLSKQPVCTPTRLLLGGHREASAVRPAEASRFPRGTRFTTGASPVRGLDQ